MSSHSTPTQETRPDEESIRFVCEPTPEEYIEFLCWMEFQRPSRQLQRQRARRTEHRQYITAAILAPLLVWLWLSGAHWLMRTFRPSNNDALPLILFLGSCAGLFFILRCVLRALTALRPNQDRALRRRILARAAELSRQDPVHLTIDRRGVQMQRGSSSWRVPWDDYGVIVETDTIIVSGSTRGAYGFCPKRCLGAGQELERRLQLTRAWIDAGGGGQKATVYPLLASCDVPCPGCGYNLRGLEVPGCPECGLLLERRLLNPRAP